MAGKRSECTAEFKLEAVQLARRSEEPLARRTAQMKEDEGTRPSSW